VKPRPTAAAAAWIGAVLAAPVRAPALGVLAGGVLAGCDPIVNVQGSFFPSWIVCMVVAGVVTALLRLVFASIRIEPHLGPLLLIYPSLWVLVTMLTWLALYRT
jgi:hypothetical protein